MPPQWLQLPGVPRQHPPSSQQGCRDSRTGSSALSCRGCRRRGTMNRKGIKSETDPGGIPTSCSRAKSVQAEGISIGNVWISQIHSLRQRDSPRLRHTHRRQAGGPFVRGGPREPSLISSLENNPWEVSPKGFGTGFGTGFGASIHASCTGGKHPSHANHPEG